MDVTCCICKRSVTKKDGMLFTTHRQPVFIGYGFTPIHNSCFAKNAGVEWAQSDKSSMRVDELKAKMAFAMYRSLIGLLWGIIAIILIAGIVTKELTLVAGMGLLALAGVNILLIGVYRRDKRLWELFR